MKTNHVFNFYLSLRFSVISLTLIPFYYIKCVKPPFLLISFLFLLNASPSRFTLFMQIFKTEEQPFVWISHTKKLVSALLLAAASVKLSWKLPFTFFFNARLHLQSSAGSSKQLLSLLLASLISFQDLVCCNLQQWQLGPQRCCLHFLHHNFCSLEM